MYATNFTYDGVTLASKGYILCEFSSGDNTRSGSKISFQTVPVNKGQKVLMADARYDECLTTTLHICKNMCNISNQENLKLTPAEVSDLSRWLNKKAFKSMIFDATGWSDIIFEASFNISTVEIGGEIYGLELEMITNRPFAVKTERTVTLTFTAGAQTQTFEDTSDEIGYIYPNSLEVTCGANGNLNFNLEADRRTIVNNCTSGEKITFTYPTISSSNDEHTTLFDDFNYVFPRISNTAEERTVEVITSMACTMVIKYNPIIKVTL